MEWQANRLFGTVSYDKRRDKWCAQVVIVKPKLSYRKRFATKSEAEAAVREFNITHGLSKNEWRYTDETKSVVELKLSQDKVTQFDAGCLEKILKFVWYARKHGNNWYACSEAQSGGKKTHNIQLHHVITGPPPANQVVDHISGVTLDNRASNLRFVTRRQNVMNNRLQRNNRTGKNGISIQHGAYRFTWRDTDGRQRGRYFRFRAPRGWTRHTPFETQEEAFSAAVAFGEGIRVALGNTNGIRPKDFRSDVLIQ